MKISLSVNKKIIAICSAVLFGALGFENAANAASFLGYNPPVQGENFTSFINPNQMTAGFSVAGGALLNVTPTSVTVNPALGAYQNRIVLDLGYTGIATFDESSPYAQSFGTGILVPTRWCNLSGEFFGVFSNTEKMHLGNSLNLKATASKEVAENLSLGVGVGGGAMWGVGNDWNLVFDVGAVYNWGELGPMKNFRLAASVLNLGKVYNNNFTKGIYYKNAQNQWNSFPGFMTIKTGAAAEFVNERDFVLGLALDVSTPFFCNMIVDAGVQMIIWDFVKINSSWQFDWQACASGTQSWIPTIGISFKFALDTSFTKNGNWQKSDMEVGAAYKHIRGGLDAYSVGAILNLGQQDKAAPEILIEAVEEEE